MELDKLILILVSGKYCGFIKSTKLVSALCFLFCFEKLCVIVQPLNKKVLKVA